MQEDAEPRPRRRLSVLLAAAAPSRVGAGPGPPPLHPPPHPPPCTRPLHAQVDEKHGGMHPDRWSMQYAGTASFVQVKGLRPGRTYATRVSAVPQVTYPVAEVVVVPSPYSDTLLVHTLPSPPMGQPAPQLASRLKKELKVCAWMRGGLQCSAKGWHVDGEGDAIFAGWLARGSSGVTCGSGSTSMTCGWPVRLSTFISMQFRWAEPEETGGRALEYVLQVCAAPACRGGALVLCPCIISHVSVVFQCWSHLMSGFRSPCCR